MVFAQLLISPTRDTSRKSIDIAVNLSDVGCRFAPRLPARASLGRPRPDRIMCASLFSRFTTDPLDPPLIACRNIRRTDWALSTVVERRPERMSGIPDDDQARSLCQPAAWAVLDLSTCPRSAVWLSQIEVTVACTAVVRVRYVPPLILPHRACADARYIVTIRRMQQARLLARAGPPTLRLNIETPPRNFASR